MCSLLPCVNVGKQSARKSNRLRLRGRPSGAAVSLLTAMAFNPAAVSFRAKGWPPSLSRRRTGVPAFALISLTSFAAISLAATFCAAPFTQPAPGTRGSAGAAAFTPACTSRREGLAVPSGCLRCEQEPQERRLQRRDGKAEARGHQRRPHRPLYRWSRRSRACSRRPICASLASLPLPCEAISTTIARNINAYLCFCR